MAQSLRSDHFLKIVFALGLLYIPALGYFEPACAEDPAASFDSAVPVWLEGRAEEKNLFVGFRAAFDRPAKGRAILRITGSSLYRIYLNGSFVGHGPARGPHGFYRVDEWPLRDLKDGANVLAIEVAGYNVNSYYLLDQPAFLQAEVVCDARVLASTAGGGVNIEATILPQRLQKVQRYSFQRPFIEYYRLSPGQDRWWDSPARDPQKPSCSVLPARRLLIRRVPYPLFQRRQPALVVSRGNLQRKLPAEQLWKDRALVDVGPKLKGYTEAELDVIPSIELQQVQSDSPVHVNRPYQPDGVIKLGENTFHVLDLGRNLTGFIGANVECLKPARLYVTFDEILSGGDVDFKRLSCVNCVCYELQPGIYNLESFEPYTMRYLKLNVLDGECEVRAVYLREYANPHTEQAAFSCSDPRLNQIFEAARETFRQNAVDIFMDCPSRERAGWLCDSFFTSRVAFDLCGDTTIERNFFENYLLPVRFGNLPEGMLPMCYPADHYDGVFVPNWAMWFVVQLEEYLARSGDRQLVESLAPRLQALYQYFQKFTNEEGLLEKLDGWVFVEWSEANSFVQDISYPTNMLYAAALAAGGRMYNEPRLLEEAERIRACIRREAFDGEFFVDNAVRKDGRIETTHNRTEVCQYFAFYFDVATPQTHKALWNRLVNEFGPKRKKTNAFEDVHPANAFVGNYLRLELLSRYGHFSQVRDELVDFYLYMAQQTGTLWENVGAYASCDHGFASHVVHSLYRDVLGAYKIDTRGRLVRLNIGNVGLGWCEGRILTPDGPVVVKWQIEADKAFYSVDVPAGYEVQVENLVGKALVRR